MSSYAQVLLYAIPFFIVLMIVEVIYGLIIKKQTFRSFDTISSLSSGITNTIKNILGLSIAIVGYTWMYDKLAFIHIEATWIIYIVSFVLIDLAGYLNHLLNHRINFFWNEHVIHHSSEEFNLACALRQSISNIFSIQAFLLIPAALLGMPPQVIAVIAPIHLFLQFWYHTRHIPKLGFVENLIVTPSQHRVHHAINPIYLDKNMGQIFPWWDKLFGTFQEELDSEPCVYGIKKPAQTWNPVLINFQHIWMMMQDAWHTNEATSKFKIWLMPTGWRPADVKEKYPVAVIDNPLTQVKYEKQCSLLLQIWSWIQLVLTHVFLIFMLVNFESIGFPGLFSYGAFLFLHIYAYTTLMDLNRMAPVVELLKYILGLYIIYSTGDWYGLNGWWASGSTVIMSYMSVSLLAVAAFSFYELRREE